MPYTRLQWVHVNTIYTQHSTRSSDAIASLSVHLGTASLTCFQIFVGCLSRSSNCRFQTILCPITNCWRSQIETQVVVTWPVTSSLSALMRPWRCDSLALSHPDLSNPLLREVLSDSTACKDVSCNVRLQPFLWITNTSSSTRAHAQQCTHRCSFSSRKRSFSITPWHAGALDYTARSTTCLAGLCQMYQPMFPHTTQRVFHNSIKWLDHVLGCLQHARRPRALQWSSLVMLQLEMCLLAFTVLAPSLPIVVSRRLLLRVL